MAEIQEAPPPTSVEPPPDPTDVWLDSPFLSVDDGNAGNGLDMRNYLNYARYQTQATAWFTDEQVDWALEAIRSSFSITSTSDIVIATTQMSNLLYRISAGVEKADADPEATAPADRKPLQERFSDEYTAFSGKRYVFLPVNNGMKTTVDDALRREKEREEEKKKEEELKARAQEEAESSATVTTTNAAEVEPHALQSGNMAAEQGDNWTSQEPPAPEPHVRRLAGGAHWSFIVLDTTLNTARYIDGLVLAVQGSRNKHRITGYELNAPVGGKILCGFDTFMQRTKGQFTASTLKWTPHQFHDNKCKSDHGACGPHVYALIKHIIEYRAQTLGRGVKRYFSQSRKILRCREVGFDSVRHRDQIQKQLWRQRQLKEVESAGTEAVVPPSNFTEENLTKILNPEVLARFLSPEILVRLLDIHQPQEAEALRTTTEATSVQGIELQKRHEEFVAAVRARYTKESKPEDFTEDVLEIALDLYYDAGTDLEKVRDELCDRIMKLLGAKTSINREEWRKRYDFAIKTKFTQDSSLSLEEFRQFVWNDKVIKVALRQLYNDTHGLPSDDPGPDNNETPVQGAYDLSITGNLTIPDGYAMPKDFADTDKVDATTLEQWKLANNSVLEPMIVNKRKANDMSYRAALHALSKRGWNRESDDKMKSVWITDSNAVNGRKKKDITAAEIRQMMRNAYRVQDDDAIPDRPTITGGVIGGASVPAKKRTKVYPPGSGPDKLPQFATTSVDTLDIFVNHNADLFADRDLSTLAKETQRAVMHRTYKGSFKSESERDLRNVWHKDPHAFTEEEQNGNWTWAEIAQRMDDVYVDLYPPIFISLYRVGIDVWLQNLPKDIRKKMIHANGEVLYRHAPGILHRLFVGEFEELRATGDQNTTENITILAKWRENDLRKYDSVDEAVNGLKFRFGNDDGGSMDLPFLRESPLHWPPREHLPAREGGTKRKRTSPVPGGGAQKKTKIDWLTISNKDLAAYVTKDITNDASIESGRPRSHTTYRAILFVRDGGSFKDEGEDRCRNLWIHDSNVFTRNKDWVANEDGSTELVNITWQQVRTAMQARYEKKSASTKRPRSGEDDTRPSKRAKTDGVNWAYIASIIGNETPDFTRMPSTSVEKWVDALIKDFPAALGHRKSKGIWPYRAVLQHLYGSFDELTNDDKSHWLKYHPAFSGGKATIDDVTKTLKNSVEDIGPLNVRGVLTSYPKSYLDRFAERHPEDPDSTQPAPDPESVTEEGNLDYLSESNGSDVEFDDEFDDELEEDNTE